MAIGLKNSGDIISDVLADVQFAVNEQCAANSECSVWKPFIKANKPVFHIEYPNEGTVYVDDVAKWCTLAPEEGSSATNITDFSTVIKDMNLTGWVEMCDKKVYTTAAS